MRRTKEPIQQTLFPKKLTGDLNTLTRAQAEEILSKKKLAAPEKRIMEDLIRAAFALGLPCIHIQYFCGNKFYPVCTGSHERPHAPTPAVCPVCHQRVLAHCRATNNKHLAGHYDIIGVAWAIETKHKVNKGDQDPTKQLSDGQRFKSELYGATDVPSMVINEGNINEAVSFLTRLSKEKNAKNLRGPGDNGQGPGKA